MDTTNVLSSYFMTVDMHRFAFMWLVYSRNKFFRVGPNISEKFVPGGANFRGVQIKHDSYMECGCSTATGSLKIADVMAMHVSLRFHLCVEGLRKSPITLI